MIGFATTFEKTERQCESCVEQEDDLDDVVAQQVNENCSAPVNAARQLIAGKPAIYCAIAFAIGGVLGWLTSKK